MKKLIYSTVVITLLFQSSCAKDDSVQLAEEVLPIVNERQQDDWGFSTKAIDINDAGSIIGWSYADSEPLYRHYERPNNGFYIKSDETGYQKIDMPDAYCTWPRSINNNDVIVGAFLPGSVDRTPSDTYALPCTGFIYDVKSGNYKELLIQGNTYTVLSQINDNGIAFGYYGIDLEYEFDRKYFLYDCSLSKMIDFVPGGHEKFRIWTMNKEYFVVSYRANDELNEDIGIAVIYRFSDFMPIDTIPMQQLPFMSIAIASINNNNLLVGNYLDMNENNFGNQGFIYQMGSKQIKLIDIKPTIGKWKFVECKPCDVNDNGIITGVARKLDTSNPFMPKNRAFKLHADLSGFEDITPPNRDGFAEAFAINNANEICGYAGFFNKAASFKTRAFVVKK